MDAEVQNAENSEITPKTPAPVPRKIGKPYVKGESGNPGGRPRTRFISEALRDALAGGDAQLLANQMLKLAKGKGRAVRPSVVLAAVEAIADRVEGKPTQSVQVTASIDEQTAQKLLELAKLLK